MTRGTIPPARWVSWLQLLTRRATRHQIAGQSMEPTLSAGDVVVVDRKATPKVGDVVVCRHPFKTDVHVCKRVYDMTAESALDLRGDNAKESTDSRSYGAVPRVHLLGVVIARLS